MEKEVSQPRKIENYQNAKFNELEGWDNNISMVEAL